MVLLRAFVKKYRATPKEDIDLAKARLKRLGSQRWH